MPSDTSRCLGLLRSILGATSDPVANASLIIVSDGSFVEAYKHLPSPMRLSQDGISLRDNPVLFHPSLILQNAAVHYALYHISIESPISY